MSQGLNEIKQKVVEYIERTRSDLTEFLSQYIRFRSINPDMLASKADTQLKQCQEWLQAQLSSWGVFDEVRILARDPSQPNVVAVRKGAGDGQALLLNGHSDVVPVTGEQEAVWTLGTPWGGEVVNGRICGRGASDMKAGCAAVLWAVRALAAADVQLSGDLIVSLVSGEETGNHTVGVDMLAEAGYRAPFAVLAEPTDMRICPASVGEFYFLIRVEGRSTSLCNRHLSIYPQRYGVEIPGVNAIDKMWKIQSALGQLEREWGVWQRHDLMEPGNMSINLSRIHGGETYSSMAESCELTGSVLFNPSLSVAQVVEEFRRCIDGVIQSDYWLRDHPPIVTLPYVLDAKEPINTSPDHPGCRALIRAYREVLNREPLLACTTGTSDGNYMYARGQQIVTFGPGCGDAGVHGPNEHVMVVDLVQATKVYALMAMEWCGMSALQGD